MFLFNKKIDKKLKEYINLKLKNRLPVIISYKNSIKTTKNSIIKNGGKIKYEYKNINAISCELNPLSIDRISENPDISFICLDYKATLCLNRISEAIGVNYMSSLNFTGKNIGIALIDTGCFPHPDLVSNRKTIYYFKDLINDINKPYDDNGHGTFLSGIMCSNGNTNKLYKGIAPDAKLCVFKCFNSLGSGYMSDIIMALDIILSIKDEYNIKVICLPFEFPYLNKLYINPLEEIINKLIENNINIVVPSGNLGSQNMSIYFPGNMKNVITVGGIDVDISSKLMKVAYFSGRGPTIDGLNKPDLVIPCTNILSLNCDISYNPNLKYKYNLVNPYKTASGTSISCAVVCACIAVLLEKTPELCVNDVKSMLCLSCKSIGENKNSQGAGIFTFKEIVK